jgi:uncharacterized metal-binding protein YceD (DUF177 family)
MSKTKRIWSVPVAVHDIPEAGRRFALDADHNVRAAIAKVAGLRSLARLSASFEVNRHGSQGLHVIGTITARAGQTCVVSLEPIENEVEENVDLLFVPPPARSNAGRTEDVSLAEAIEDAAAEVLVNGTVDLGAIATEFLLLGIDPYPRKSGVEFAPASAGNAMPEHPFAALAALKGKKHGNDT